MCKASRLDVSLIPLPTHHYVTFFFFFFLSQNNNNNNNATSSPCPTHAKLLTR